MPSTRRARTIASAWLLVAVLLVLLPGTAFAAQTMQGRDLTVAGTQTINDDLYLFGNTLTIDGRVNGDVIGAANTVDIHGTVTGDVLVSATSVTISGRVGGSVRALAGTITIDGTVGKDLVAAGGTVHLSGQAQVHRDVLLGAGTVLVDGGVGRNLQVNTGTLRLGTGAVVGANLLYSGVDHPDLAAGASVHGTAMRQSAPTWTVNGMLGGSIHPVIAWIRTLIGLWILGLLFMLLFPAYDQRVTATLCRIPLQSLGSGVLGLILVPIIALILFIIGLLIGGWWIGLILLGLYAFALVLGFIASGAFIGNLLLMRAGRSGIPAPVAILLGLAILLLIGLVPIVGGIVDFTAMLFGLGALILTAVRAGRCIALS